MFQEFKPKTVKLVSSIEASIGINLATKERFVEATSTML